MRVKSDFMNSFKSLLAGAGVAVLCTGCVTNPITGRSTIQFEDNSQINALSLQQYNQTISKADVIKGTADARMVQQVGERLAAAATKYYTSIGQGQLLANYHWEFNLLKDKQINAWCMPGGKVVVYSGILPYTKDADGLAVVLGHEISHALAGHGNEQMSREAMAQGLGQILGSAAGNGQASKLISELYPTVGGVALLSFSRKQESEADEMGLMIMAMAGYNPQAAVPFWERMSQAGGANSTPAFLSTHPSDAQRISNLKAWMPKAMQYYNAAIGKK